MIEAFHNRIKLELSKPLPGLEAHLEMMPIARDEKFLFPEFDVDPVKSAVLLLFYQDNAGRIKFPLIQRPTYNGAHSGQVGLPGGKAERTDKNIIQTALREASEEIGIIAEQVNVIGKLSDLHISVSNFIVTPVIGVTHSRPEFIPEPEEVVAVIESDLDDIVNPEKRKTGVVTAGGKFKVHTPYIDIGDRIVWGATAMILNELSKIVAKSGIR